jgi:hypothetical protein
MNKVQDLVTESICFDLSAPNAISLKPDVLQSNLNTFSTFSRK